MKGGKGNKFLEDDDMEDFDFEKNRVETSDDFFRKGHQQQQQQQKQNPYAAKTENKRSYH